jgi:hypothetical protein
MSQVQSPVIKSKVEELPRYETPKVKDVSEAEILKTFQITQSMAGWWTTGMC